MPKLKALADYNVEIIDEMNRLIGEGAEPRQALKQAILMYEEYVEKENAKC